MPRHIVESPAAAPGERAPYARSLILAALSLAGVGLVLAPDKTVSTIETIQVPASPAEAWAAFRDLFETSRGATCEA